MDNMHACKVCHVNVLYQYICLWACIKLGWSAVTQHSLSLWFLSGLSIIDRVPEARPICNHFYAFVCVTAFQSNSHIQLSSMLEVTGSYNCKQFYILLWMIEHANSHSKTLMQRLKGILLWTIEHANSQSKTLMQHFASHRLCQVVCLTKPVMGETLH